MREVSLCARDKHEGCDAVGEVAHVGCGVRMRAEGCVRRYYFFPTLNGTHDYYSTNRGLTRPWTSTSSLRTHQLLPKSWNSTQLLSF